SWLDFNQRVLELAEDPEVPLLERLRFCGIYASNLDEFFMVRVAGVHDQLDAGVSGRQADGMTATETMEAIAKRVRELGRRLDRCFETELRPQLASHGIRIVPCSACSEEELRAVDQRFSDEIFPVLTPLGVGPGRPFPYISNLSLSLAVRVRDPETQHETFARVKVPREVLPRFIALDDGVYVPLEEVISRNLHRLFPGMEILSHEVFRVTRDADLEVSDEADDLLEAVEAELRQRRFGEVVRLEVGRGMSQDLRIQLIESLRVETRDVHEVDGLCALTDLWQIYGVEGADDLREAPYTRRTPPAFVGDDADVFAAMREGDILVHHPYDSFSATVERFVEQAVSDPDVLAIKTTVYRTSDDSVLVPALIKAAEAGKQAVCIVELTARFDERRNIEWARALERSGAHVVHGLPGLKTHAKMLLVVRREGRRARHYVHLGTGNYHAKTARTYEDYGLFTADPVITDDVADLFNLLTGYGNATGFHDVLVAPTRLRRGLIAQIEATVEAAGRGEHARILLKCNQLVDPATIQALYQASQAGVEVNLNVRGICALRPGVPGVSENIRVVSVVGRFLEHSRVYLFERAAERVGFIGSADLMQRNLDHRVEILVPIKDAELSAQLTDVVERCLADDTFAWDLGPDGRWIRRSGGTRSVHAELMELATTREPPDET
ncbi:MAG: polyphosphate kinase, partial [Solirubrobacteraceae bacterium]|nr:polyphosphate kinase [Solirubrobacteraceae bacterium]